MMVNWQLTLDKLYNYIDASETGCDGEKNLMDVSGDDLERLAAELNSDRRSSSSNGEATVNTCHTIAYWYTINKGSIQVTFKIENCTK